MNQNPRLEKHQEGKKMNLARPRYHVACEILQTILLFSCYINIIYVKNTDTAYNYRYYHTDKTYNNRTGHNRSSIQNTGCFRDMVERTGNVTATLPPIHFFSILSLQWEILLEEHKKGSQGGKCYLIFVGFLFIRQTIGSIVQKLCPSLSGLPYQSIFPHAKFNVW